MPLLSFIIPYFNAEDTIIQTLHSIYYSGLDPSSFEVIIVDDCSTIPAADTLRAHRFNNLKIIRHDHNKRQGAARNTGIRNALGDYIAFVDADDLVLPGVSYAINLTVDSQPDIVACQYIKHSPKGDKKIYGFDICDKTSISGKSFCEQYVNTSVHFCIWLYLFSKDYLRKSYFPFTESVFMEDGDWVARHLFYAESIIITDAIIYEYLYRPTSTVHSREFTHLSGWVLTGLRKIQIANEVMEFSPLYSSILIKDARWNIEGAFKKLYTITRINRFYQSISFSQWSILKQFRWPWLVSIMINHKVLSTFVLSILSPLFIVYKRISK